MRKLGRYLSGARPTNRLVATVLAVLVAMGAIAWAQDGSDPAARAQIELEALQGVPYTDWAFEPGVPEGYYVGVEPHGLVLQVFLNQVAYQDLASGADTFSDGAIIMKENHMPTGVDVDAMPLQAAVPGFEGDLASYTFMIKDEGYNPDGGDWFWAKLQADGSVDAAGTPDGCLGCHAQVEDNDWVFNAQLGQ